MKLLQNRVFLVIDKGSESSSKNDLYEKEVRRAD